jgi:YidC/Oxa1 family membrane protein insertase
LLLFLAFTNPLQPIVNALSDVLSILNGITHNFGWSLVIFALLVKLVLWPLSQMQFKSMAEMQRIAPQVKKLQAQYKGDAQKMNTEVMALYKEHGVNPMAGCLPLLIQMPILFSLYWAINTQREEFATQGWLWIGSVNAWLANAAPAFYHWLAGLLPAFNEVVKACPSALEWGQACVQNPPAKDGLITFTLSSHYVFAPDLAKSDLLLLGLYVLSMYFSVRYGTAPASDPAQAQQQKIMAFISPVMIAWFGHSWPSALILYWFFFNAFSMAQSFYLLRKYGAYSQPAPAAAVPVDAKNAAPREGSSRSNGKLTSPKGESATAPRKKRSRR